VGNVGPRAPPRQARAGKRPADITYRSEVIGLHIDLVAHSPSSAGRSNAARMADPAFAAK